MNGFAGMGNAAFVEKVETRDTLKSKIRVDKVAPNDIFCDSDRTGAKNILKCAQPRKHTGDAYA